MKIFLSIIAAISWLHVNGLTVSYLTYLYEKYHSELVGIRTKFAENCSALAKTSEFASWKMNSGVMAFDAELVYMRIRETKPLGILEFGADFELMSRFVLSAVQANFRDGVAGHITSVPLRQRDGVVVQQDEHLRSIISLNVTQSIRTILSSNSEYDQVVLGSDISNSHFEFLVDKILEPSILQRSLDKPALQLYFHISHRLNMEVNSSYPANNTNHHHKSRHHSSQINSGLLKWLNGQIHRSIEVELISPKKLTAATHVLQQWRHNPTKDYCDYFVEHSRSTFGFASIHRSPRLTLLTPCSRPELLDVVLHTIKFHLISEWIIVYTRNITRTTPHYSWHPKITELFNHDMAGNWGNPERNIGINYATQQQNTGFLYFLDDDNFMHPNMWTLLQDAAAPGIIFFGQLRIEKPATSGPGKLSHSDMCKKYHGKSELIFVF